MQVLALYYDSKFIKTVLNEILNCQEPCTSTLITYWF